MKRFIVLTIAVFTILTLPQTSFAARLSKSSGTAFMVIEGTIESLDQAKHRFVIKDQEDGKTYNLSTRDTASLNQGDLVKVRVSYPGNLVSKIIKK